MSGQSIEDQIDWKQIDHLHAAVLQLAGFCFELKRFCITTEFLVLALLSRLTGNALDLSFFVAGLAIPLGFWFLDAVAYYYQDKLRVRMDALYERIAARNGNKVVYIANAVILKAKSTGLQMPRRVIGAVLNHSMWLYGLLALADGIAGLCFRAGFI